MSAHANYTGAMANEFGMWSMAPLRIPGLWEQRAARWWPVWCASAVICTAIAALAGCAWDSR